MRRSIRPFGADDAARAVCKVLARHVSQGELEEAKQALPQDVRTFFPQ